MEGVVMKEFWADKYVGKKWFFPESGYPEEKMCILLVLHILKEQKDFDISDTDEERIKNSDANWYDKAPREFIAKASKYGKIITDYKELREFDVPFFNMYGNVRHCGVMIDNYGSFLHQLNKDPAIVSKINSRRWLNRFYAGIRCF